MLMHYVESVLLAIVSAALFTIGLRRGGFLWSVASALLYLAALLSKEIAAPLPLILLLLPERDARSRLRRVAPHGVALLVYLGWRYRLLGTAVGGYGASFAARELGPLVLRTAGNIARTLAGPRLAIGIALLLLLACGIALRMRMRRNAASIALAFAAAVAPIVPVARQYEARFALAASLCAAVVFAAGADSLRNRRAAMAMMLGAAMLALAVNRQEWSRTYVRAVRMSDEGRVFAALGPGDVLRKPSIPPGSMYQLFWIKDNLLHRGQGTLWFFDDLFLCRRERPRRVFGYDEATRRVIDMTERIGGIAARYCASIRDSAPLQAHFRFHPADGLLQWELGPYERGAYAVVVDDGFLAYDVGARDFLRITRLPALTFRVRYQSPEGWATYSPPLTIDCTRENEVSWRR
jgi:hypothetical protein